MAKTKFNSNQHAAPQQQHQNQTKTNKIQNAPQKETTKTSQQQTKTAKIQSAPPKETSKTSQNQIISNNFE